MKIPDPIRFIRIDVDASALKTNGEMEADVSIAGFDPEHFYVAKTLSEILDAIAKDFSEFMEGTQ